MLGERGLWFKMSFLEGSARVPLMLAAPDLAPGRVDRPVSTLDLLPTLTALAGIDPAAVAPFADGERLDAAARGPVPVEYAAEGSREPMVALRDGRLKLTIAATDPPILVDLDADPHERTNLAPDPDHAADLARLTAMAHARWDLARFDAEVRESQARRRVVYEALHNGVHYPWDHQPLRRASERYMRNHLNLDTLEADRRFPRA
jgi:choline-sulfatase